MIIITNYIWKTASLKTRIHSLLHHIISRMTLIFKTLQINGNLLKMSSTILTQKTLIGVHLNV